MPPLQKAHDPHRATSHAIISDPLTVNGYSRTSEAANTITLIDSDGKILVRRTVLCNDRGHTREILRGHP